MECAARALDSVRSLYMMRSGRAFTLIELMIVIAIIAILAAILIPNYLHAVAESNTAACESYEKHIAIALEEYALDHDGTYPATGQVDTVLFGGAGNAYLNNAPHDPASPLGFYHFNTAAPDCSPHALYEIIDNGNHDQNSILTIPHVPASTTIYYCSDSGLAGK